ncbi:hypothetical protein EVAR_23548_1 [Eumeta japonica]|uniref:Uncharacterized protein n=1 Tax=Eumeta variegata TaxID=151549 RepID=A0A4C1WWC7_EUMVA|nr:hypothetical protein EVAR_23548_1 [Eumeta japonica]
MRFSLESRRAHEAICEDPTVDDDVDSVKMCVASTRWRVGVRAPPTARQRLMANSWCSRASLCWAEIKNGTWTRIDSVTEIGVGSSGGNGIETKARIEINSKAIDVKDEEILSISIARLRTQHANAGAGVTRCVRGEPDRSPAAGLVVEEGARWLEWCPILPPPAAPAAPAAPRTKYLDVCRLSTFYCVLAIHVTPTTSSNVGMIDPPAWSVAVVGGSGGLEKNLKIQKSRKPTDPIDDLAELRVRERLHPDVDLRRSSGPPENAGTEMAFTFYVQKLKPAWPYARGANQQVSYRREEMVTNTPGYSQFQRSHQCVAGLLGGNTVSNREESDRWKEREGVNHRNSLT